ncbi:SMI1/KNR4 family protein [Bacillus infantis]|uniref:SMI1/KNR4 family protein n=2 Tax=Bacillus infantis TaxID=324767 RepID=UPI00101CD90E|nr:SMI1/KNR4 family protein [Bacillus infantis]RYI27611.1 SMI1/KNR4 family protein [Bacillus infantis]
MKKQEVRRRNKILERTNIHSVFKGGKQLIMWRDYLTSISRECEFKAPATEAETALIKKELKVELPDKLAELYKETNGVYGNYGISFVWSIEQMIKENLFFWTLHERSDFMKPLDTFLFFSDAGNGDLFGYLIADGRVQTEHIYVWNHEDDSRWRVASSLEEFIRGWMIGEISV